MESPNKAFASPARSSFNDHSDTAAAAAAAAASTPHDASSQGSTKVPPTVRNSHDNSPSPIEDEKAALEKEAKAGRDAQHRIPAVANDDEKTNGFYTPAEEFAPAADKELATSSECGSRASKEMDQKEAAETTAPVLEPPVTVDDDAASYPSGTALTLLTIGLCLATFVVALDNTIIATAIPKITTVFNSLDDVGWYGSSYLLTTTSLQPTFGKIYTYFDIKWTYLIALCIFELGSIVCAAARNSVMLIVGRAIAGAGAAGLFSGGMTIIGYSVKLEKRPIYIALLSSMFGISSVVGPLLGGAFTDRLTWRWCFWINLPFGGVALATVAFFFQNPKRKHSDLTLKEKILEMDLAGAFLLICGIVCLLLALQWGGSTYPWSDSRVWGCIIGFGLIIAIFIVIQFRRGDRATIPPKLLRNRTLWSCYVFTAFLSMGLYAHIYFLPFYFQAVKSTSAEGSGIRTIPYLVSITLASIVIGGSITKFGWYTPFMWVGAAIFTVGAGLLYTLGVDSGAGKWIGYQILAGIGAGGSVQIPFVAVQVVLSPKEMPTGNALSIFFNSLGGALAVSVAQNVFSNGLVQQIPKLTQGVDPAAIIAAGATGIRRVTPPDQLRGVLQAYTIAIDRVFILPIAVSGVAFVASLFTEMKSVKGKKLDMGGGV